MAFGARCPSSHTMLYFTVDRLGNITVYLSSNTSFKPKDGSDIDFSTWTSIAYPQTCGFVCVIIPQSVESKARFVAVTVIQAEGVISLKEVKIYEHASELQKIILFQYLVLPRIT